MRQSNRRDAILKVLRENRTHPTADEVYCLVREQYPNVSLGTVYRNLKYFVQQGLVNTLETTDACLHYDGDTEEHCHFICEKCGKPFAIKMGRYGKFLACTGFPECRNTRPLLEEIGVACPKCGKGQVVKRRSKKGRVFYGCDQYPECEFVTWEKPTGEKCPSCGEWLKDENQELSCGCGIGNKATR